MVLPQWNAQPDSHVEACRIFNGLGMTALRLTLPYHQERKPPDIERAEHLVSSNIGRTIQSMRQAVLDTRAAVRWLKLQGFERIGILAPVSDRAQLFSHSHTTRTSTSALSITCQATLPMWCGRESRPSTCAQGIEGELTLEELREFWRPISPYLSFRGWSHEAASDALHRREIRSDISRWIFRVK